MLLLVQRGARENREAYRKASNNADLWSGRTEILKREAGYPCTPIRVNNFLKREAIYLACYTNRIA